MFVQKITSLPRIFKSSIIIIFDIFMIPACLIASFSLRLGYLFIPPGIFDNKLTILILGAPLIAIPIFLFFGLYRAIIRFIGFTIQWSIFKAVVCYSIIWGLVSLITLSSALPRSVIIINFLVTVVCIGGSRLLIQYFLRTFGNSIENNKSADRFVKENVLIYGAGEAGRQLAVGLFQSNKYLLNGFIDDDVTIQGRDIMGLKVISFNDVKEISKKDNIDLILLAIPSLSRMDRNHILKNLLPLKIRVKTLPGLSELTNKFFDPNMIQELEIDDLLMRSAIDSPEESLKLITQDKAILVTGAGGSIGSEICRKIIIREPKLLVLFEISEFNLYTIHKELENICLKISKEKNNYRIPKIIPLLGSIQDKKRLLDIMSTWRPNIVYHAAAYKHVPLVESNISEAINNNIFGTLNLAEASVLNNVENFILISTDKAVNPTNAMGASKRIAELILQGISAEDKIVFDTESLKPLAVKQSTNFCKVRFGNVLGSSGSVVPLFREQIKKGGPITLTHKDITRYFMSISEAVELVMQSALFNQTYSKASEVYLLDMGEPVKIIDLAYRMVELSGLRVKTKTIPDGEIEIIITGLRKGEKLYEELLLTNNAIMTNHPKIWKAKEEFIDWKELSESLTLLKKATDRFNYDDIIKILTLLVEGYKPKHSHLLNIRDKN